MKDREEESGELLNGSDANSEVGARASLSDSDSDSDLEEGPEFEALIDELTNKFLISKETKDDNEDWESRANEIYSGLGKNLNNGGAERGEAPALAEGGGVLEEPVARDEGLGNEPELAVVAGDPLPAAAEAELREVAEPAAGAFVAGAPPPARASSVPTPVSQPTPTRASSAPGGAGAVPRGFIAEAILDLSDGLGEKVETPPPSQPESGAGVFGVGVGEAGAEVLAAGVAAEEGEAGQGRLEEPKILISSKFVYEIDNRGKVTMVEDLASGGKISSRNTDGFNKACNARLDYLKAFRDNYKLGNTTAVGDGVAEAEEVVGQAGGGGGEQISEIVSVAQESSGENIYTEHSHLQRHEEFIEIYKKMATEMSKNKKGPGFDERKKFVEFYFSKKINSGNPSLLFHGFSAKNTFSLNRTAVNVDTHSPYKKLDEMLEKLDETSSSDKQEEKNTIAVRSTSIINDIYFAECFYDLVEEFKNIKESQNQEKEKEKEKEEEEVFEKFLKPENLEIIVWSFKGSIMQNLKDSKTKELIDSLSKEQKAKLKTKIDEIGIKKFDQLKFKRKAKSASYSLGGGGLSGSISSSSVASLFSCLPSRPSSHN